MRYSLKTYHFLIIIFCSIFLFASCSSNEESTDGLNDQQLFVKKDASYSGIEFINSLLETEEFNYFNFQYIYMGGGVSVADFNNDDLEDIYFTGNMVDNKLYLNEGDLQFTDVSIASKTMNSDLWSTGSTTVDINNDGWLDIYVSVGGRDNSFANKLYVNQGTNEKGVPVFLEQAEKYGIADKGRTQQSIFFDYDNDGDLDLYVINYPTTDFKTPVSIYALLLDNAQHETSSHFYKNNGDNTFSDVTKESGLLSFGLSIGVSVSDVNNDGFKDIYVSNDFASPDFFYMNNGDGTFSEKSKEITQQTSYYGMGTDIADFNNDGLFDIVQLDMAPTTHKRSKENMASMLPEKFDEIIGLGLHHQYMYNSLQVNRGVDKAGLPVYSNIAAFSGVKSTDWSWAGLFADFDNDGLKDLFISNGTRRDINNNDFFNQFKKSLYFEKTVEHKKDDFKILEKMPSEPLANFLFHNNGDLTFTNKSEEWGLGDKAFSNGAAYADFDNDGDLDLVVNNIDAKADLYENTIESSKSNNYLKIKFEGTQQNPMGVGNIATIYKDGNLQVSELMLTRGYQSSVAPTIHFGIGETETIDSLIVKWVNGNTQKLINVPVNQTLNLSFEESIYVENNLNTIENKTVFSSTDKGSKIDFKHVENNYFDFTKEPLLPHKMSQFGPGLAVADINGDGLDDFWVGGALNRPGALYIQDEEGSFKKSNIDLFQSESRYEDIDGIFFDANSDGLQDLYVVSGGNEFEANSEVYEDRLYVNKGNGLFKRDTTALPKAYESGGKVLPFDFDNDGDLDLFVGSRLVPQNYPTPATSHLLENVSNGQGVKFKDVTSISSPFTDLGLVTDAISIDFDNDNDEDLIVVGEWMPITFLENDNNSFKNVTSKNYLEHTTGWWYSISKTDLDKDGDQDFIVGNLGLNYKYKAKPEKTFDVFANDFDNNDQLDIVLSYYEGKRQLPLRGRECSSQQIPGIAQKFDNYEKYADADLVDIYTEDKLEDGLHYKAESFASLYVENMGNSSFKSGKLPNEAQFSSINAILVNDYNHDGNNEVLVAGNLFSSEAETPRNDASIGLLMRYNEKDLYPLTLKESGFLANKDVKKMKEIIIGGQQYILIANNNDVLQIVEVN
ncbi:VCBS repeat-containing protein [Maribacter dokdonensis]|uniref:VCBS repeat-containing protein n=1 Tax=Maribacter dokdonensis TaxID=320912 RepID=UPI003299FF66